MGHIRAFVIETHNFETHNWGGIRESRIEGQVARKMPVKGGKRKAESLKKKFLMSEIAPHEMDFDGYKVFLKQLFTEMNTAFQKVVQNLPPPPTSPQPQ